MESNEAYRNALARCRVCRTCTAEAPEEQTACQLDAFLGKFDRAYELVVEHCEEHGC